MLGMGGKTKEKKMTVKQMETEIVAQLKTVEIARLSMADMTRELDVAIKELESQKAELTKKAKAAHDVAEARVKELAVLVGHTVAGENLQAVYVSGRRNWNSDKLEGLALTTPEVLECLTVGKPTAQIRNVGGNS